MRSVPNSSSFNVEEFGTERIQRLTNDEINTTFRYFKRSVPDFLSLNVEELATERIHRLTNDEINQRFRDFKRFTHFEEIPFERAVGSEEHTSELQSRFGISYAVFCLKK